MGTGVGEAALAAEAIGAAEAATAGAGFLEGMAGVSALEGAGVAGLGLGTGAGLGTALAGAGAGGLGALSPAFQTALGQTAAVMPEVAAQTAQFANMGAMPGVDAALGAGQIGDPALLQTLGQGAGEAATQTLNPINYLQDVNATMELNIRPEDIVDAETLAPKVATPATPTPPREPGMYTAEPGWASKTAPTTTQRAGGIGDILKNATQPLQNWWEDQNTLTKYGLGATGALQAAKYLNKQQGVAPAEKYSGPLSKFTYSPDTYRPYTYKPYAAGGPVEEMSNRNAIGANTGYPQSDIQQGAYATPWQTPVSRNVVAGAGDVGVDQMTGMERMAGGGIANLGGYSDGGRLLKGPGDGMSDNIPATIGRKQPARLADGEFVVPADVVSGLGNGSTEAGAKQLYKMLDKVRSARTGTKKQGKQINPNKYTPA
jgi:hypothetical protein